MIVATGDAWQNLISNRYFLADATFLVGFQGDLSFLRTLHSALSNPRWPLYLGRKSYLPSLPLFLPDALHEGLDLRSALLSYPLLSAVHNVDAGPTKNAERGNGLLRLVLESETPTHESRRDQPISFALGQRVFHERYLTVEYVNIEGLAGKGD